MHRHGERTRDECIAELQLKFELTVDEAIKVFEDIRAHEALHAKAKAARATAKE